jgi:hypothetical protein
LQRQCRFHFLPDRSGEDSHERVEGWEPSVDFVREGLGIVQGILEGAELRLAPFAWMPSRHSRYFLGHEHFFDKTSARPEGSTLLHTGYFWLGGKLRRIRVALQVTASKGYRVRFKIHRTRGQTPWIAELQSQVDLDGAGSALFHELSLDADAGCSYAVLAELLSGDVTLVDASITVAPAGAHPIRVA